MRIVKVAIAQVSYKGPHKHCFDQHEEFFHYLGRLQERSFWINAPGLDPEAVFSGAPEFFPKLDSTSDTAELCSGDPVFQFYTITETGNSIVAQARDRVVERALKYGIDYLFFFDDDMIFARDAFLRLWRRQKPFVGALAFTAREPICPVLFRFRSRWDFKKRAEVVDIEPIFDYQENALVQVDAIGAGVVLISTEVFSKLDSPWFQGSVGMGEDVYLGWKCGKAGIPVYCDTAVKTMHVPNEPKRWHDETYYLEQKEQTRAFWERQNKAAV